MPMGKRELARIERRLIATLTDACETAKAEIKDLSDLARTLRVTWVFETLADKKLAEASAKVRILELTAIALKEADIDLKPSDHTVRFDSEEECQRTHGGDWNKRLAQFGTARGH